MNVEFAYDSAQYPPQPVAEIAITAPQSSIATPRLRATIDTGADVTLIPLKTLRPLAAPLGDSRRVRSLWGDCQEVNTFIVDVHIGNLVLPAIEVLGYAGDEIILGRDILNKLWLELDGPAQTVEVADKRPRRR